MARASALTASTALAQHRITRLATQLSTHRALHWLHLHQLQLRLWQTELVSIPAPPFQEARRAAWFLDRFEALGLTNIHLDEAGNAFGELAGAAADPLGAIVLLSAHLDTVFPAGTELVLREDGSRMFCPGVCDNGAGLTALLALAAALRFAQIKPEATIVFAANVGEEGEGDLRGMRWLFKRGTYVGRIRAALALEGSGSAAAVDRGLGSRRFRVTIDGPGGHSWSDAAMPNPITILARGISALAALPLSPDAPRTTLGPGQIAGGTSINSIPETAHVLLDLRSTDALELEEYELEIHRIFEQLVFPHATARLNIERIGCRPAAALPEDSALRRTLLAVDRHLGLRTELRIGSTDANIPLAQGVPAVALAAGGTGGGIHTLGEWYDPTGRETALRRVLLILLDVCAQA